MVALWREARLGGEAMTTRLFHISDVHFGVEDRCALEAVEQAVRDEKPDALICTGDLTQRAKHSEYAAAANWFGGLGVPVVLEGRWAQGEPPSGVDWPAGANDGWWFETDRILVKHDNDYTEDRIIDAEERGQYTPEETVEICTS